MAIASDSEYVAENKMLLTCARTDISPDLVAPLQAKAGNGIDWQYFLQTAVKHDVMSLVGMNLAKFCDGVAPGEVLQSARAAFHANALYNQVMTRELIRLLARFKARNILAVPFKGPVLAASVYRNPALRQYEDLDIFVSEKDVRAAKEILLASGYRLKRARSDQEEDQLIQNHWEYKFEQNSGPVVVELQWRITSRFFSFPISLDMLRNRLQLTQLRGHTVHDFPPEILLLILCVHGTRHEWRKLNWICDVAELLRRYPDLDWDWTLREARLLGIQRMVHLGVLLSQELVGAPVPEKILSRAQKSGSARLLRGEVVRQLFGTATIDRSDRGKSISRLQKSIFRIRTRERISDKFQFLLGFMHRLFVPRSRDWSLVTLPDSLAFLYYVLRPIRLFVKYAGQVCSRK